MYLKIWILLLLLISSTLTVKADKDFSLAIELENSTLNLSDTNLSKSYDDSRYYFWIYALITNEVASPQKLIVWVCGGYGFEIESNSVQSALKCRKNYFKSIILQPQETYKVRIPLSFKKDYKGNTLKFRILYKEIRAGWSEFATVKLLR